jgi:glycosyltransferase involved in cell wall biosynthesis
LRAGGIVGILSPTMRVLHVYKDYYPPIHGGIEVTINQIIRHTRQECEDIQVLVANRQLKTETVEVEGIQVTKVFDFGRFRSSPLAPTFPLWLKRLAADRDILHIHSPNPIAGASVVLARPKAKIVVHYHSDIVRQRALLQMYRPFLEKFLDRADRIIATSPNYIPSSAFLAPRAEKCVPIPFGVDFDRFEKTPEMEQEIARIRQEYGENIVLFVGKIRYYKGLHYLVEAMEKVQDGHLLVIGDGPLLGDLLRWREKLPYKNRLSFLGGVPRIEPYFHAAKVFCLPSFLRSEAFAVVQIEAAACSLPVVNTRIDSGVPYVGLDGVSGITVEPENPLALAEAIDRLLKDEPLRQKLGRSARERALREFTLEQMSKKILGVYRDVMNEKPA